MDSPEFSDDSFDDASNLSEETILIENPTQMELIIGGFRELTCLLGLLACMGVSVVSNSVYPRIQPNSRYHIYTFVWTLLPFIVIAVFLFAIDAAGVFTGAWPTSSDLSCKILWGSVKPIIATTPGFLIMWLTVSITGENCLFKCKWFPVLCVLISVGIGVANSILPSIHGERKNSSGDLGQLSCSHTIPYRLNIGRVLGEFLIGYILPFLLILVLFGAKLCPEPRLKLIKFSLAGVVASHWIGWLPVQIRQLFQLGGYEAEGLLRSLETLWCSLFVCVLLPLFLIHLLVRLSKAGRFRKMSELQMVPLTKQDAELYQRFLQSGNGMKRVATIEWGFI